MSSYNLSENHQRSVNAVATLLERKLEELETSLFRDKRNARGVRIFHLNDLSETQKLQIQDEIERLYSLLNAFCDQYHVPKETLSLQHEVKVKASFLWEELSEASRKKFKGYGNDDSTIQKEYDNLVNEMVDTANRIIDYSNENSRF